SSRSGESSPKILDLVSAQFAASAVISALPPSCGHKLHNTHGVRHPSGPSSPPYSSTLSKAGLSARGTLSSSHPRSLPLQRSQVGAVGPAHPHTARSSAPTTSALKLAAAR
ncbi:enhancer of polycomb homolog 2-like, partial [Plectropomus leopardus]